MLDFLRVGVLVVTLAAACAADLRRRKIPNALTFPALLLGLALAGCQGGTPELAKALAGAGVASVALLLYAGRMLGAGDVKLLWAVGSLTGPRLCSGRCPARRWPGARWRCCGRRGAEPGKLPYAPAIVLGVLAAAWQCPAGLTP